MTSATTYTCHVCGVHETEQRLLTECSGCGELYHLNPYNNRPGVDCGDAWIDDESLGMQMYCQDCIDQAKLEDAAEWARQGIDQGHAPEQIARDLEAAFPGVTLPGLLNFPGFAGMPTPVTPATPPPPSTQQVSVHPEPVEGRQAMSREGKSLDAGARKPAATSASTTNEPPPLRARPRSVRRYRRVD